MISVQISGFNTKAEAEAFIDWYEGQGEQDAGYWFEARKEEGKIDISFMPTDIKKTFPIKWDGEQAHLVLKMVE